jgi:hypothetical protein
MCDADKFIGAGQTMTLTSGFTLSASPGYLEVNRAPQFWTGRFRAHCASNSTAKGAAAALHGAIHYMAP